MPLSQAGIPAEPDIACLQNAAFAEWPNLYRVLRVYPDRIEWEVRQVHNRGFVSEGAFADAESRGSDDACPDRL
ncbi:MAG: hypothetical protein RBU24_09295 [Kiritimatiellia bacterium]|nr:hypothetical protein [Kiritimatiellia bacterium]